ncbi:MAG: MFS transporter [Saprospiraceae bacterium]|nr:MFS transporter [Saprospiraceae bacterium]
MNASKKINPYRCAAAVAFGGLVFGLDAALISGTVGFITTEFGLNDLQIGTVVGVSGFGVLVALILVGYVSDQWGRRKTLKVIAALYVVSAVCSTLAPSYLTLVAARFLGGLAFTSITLSAMYIGEIAPPAKRGQLVAINQINIVVGLSAAYFINYLILQLSQSDLDWAVKLGIDRHTWRWMLGSEILFAVIWFFLLFSIPPSPRWLVLKGRIEEAKGVLRGLLEPDQAEEELASIISSASTKTKTSSLRDQFKTLLHPSLRIAVIVGLVYAVVQQITGINAVLFYAPTVFEQLGLGKNSAFMQAVWVGLVGLLFTILALLLVDRVGRRSLTLWGLLWAILSLAICAYGFHQATYILSAADLASISTFDTSSLANMAGIEYRSDVEFKAALNQSLGGGAAKQHEAVLFNMAANLPSTLVLFGVMSFVAAFHFSIGPIMWVIFSEIFPTRIRGLAIPVFALITSTVSYLVQQFFPWQLTNMGARDIFLFYAVAGFIGLLGLYRYLPETKGRSIEQIEAELALGSD